MIRCLTETTMVYFDVQDQLKSSKSRVTISSFAFYFLPKYNISLSTWSPRKDGTPHRQDIIRAHHILEVNASPGNQTFMLPLNTRFVNLTDSTLASERCRVRGYAHMHIWDEPMTTTVSLKVAGNFLLLLPQTLIHIQRLVIFLLQNCSLGMRIHHAGNIYTQYTLPKNHYLGIKIFL